jgi:hypothetical protein
MGAKFSDYGPDDPFYKQGPQTYSPHWARTLLGQRPPAPPRNVEVIFSPSGRSDG